MQNKNSSNKLNIFLPELDSIKTPQQYAEIKYKIPYILDLQSRSSSLLYFGSEHINNPNDPQIKLIEEAFKKHIHKYGSEKSVVVFENFTPPSGYEKEEMIKKYGEQGLVRNLTDSLKIDLMCFTLSLENIIDHVVEFEKFSQKDIALRVFLNVLCGSLNKDGRITGKTFGNILWVIENKLGVSDFSSLAQRLTELTRKNILPEKISGLKEMEFDKKEIQKIQSPFSSDTVLNEIASMMDNIQDRYVAAAIMELLSKNKNVFAVFGHNHVFAQEPVFRGLFKKMTNG